MQDDVAERLRRLPKEVQDLFTRPDFVTPDKIRQAECIDLAKLGKEVWNAWRKEFPTKDQFNQYSNRANFSRHKFTQKFDFSGFYLGDLASFENTTFEQETNFKGASFGEYIVFDDSQAQGGINFSKTQWLGDATFDGCKLTRADFTDAKFAGNLSFIGCSIEKAISFRGAKFSQSVNFSNTQFKGRTDFSGAKFEKVPLFHGCELHQDTSFEGATFPAATGDEEAERAYRTLKLAFSKHQAIREEQRFFRLEMAEEALRHKGAKRALFWLYKISSDYGFSLKRPCVALLLIFVGMAAIYGGFSVYNNACQEVCTFSPQWLSFSLLQTLPILGMDKQGWKHGDFWPKGDGWEAVLILLVVIHKTLSLVAFFLIGLALRNLFKLK